MIKITKKIWSYFNRRYDSSNQDIYWINKYQLSYLQNYNNEKSQKSIKFKYFEQLWDILKPNKISDYESSIVRVGNKNDGGYVMFAPFSKTKIAYSIGIDHDVSWDEEMADKYGYEIFQYDHTIRKLVKMNRSFHWKKIGITGGEENERLKKLSTLLASNNHSEIEGMVLKIDVEGAEWDVFNNITEGDLNSFDQIVVEFHNILDIHDMDFKINVIKRILNTHFVGHIHGNNWSDVEFFGNIVFSDAIEVTFIKKGFFDITKENVILPSVCDAPSKNERPEIMIGPN